MSKKFYAVMVVVTVLAMLLSACGDKVENGQWKPLDTDDIVESGEETRDGVVKVFDVLKAIDCSDGEGQGCETNE